MDAIKYTILNIYCLVAIVENIPFKSAISYPHTKTQNIHNKRSSNTSQLTPYKR